MRNAIIPASFFSVVSLRLLRVQPLRAALTWLTFHVFLALASGGISAFGFRGALLMAAAAAIVAFMDSRRRRETQFLGNLGVSKPAAPAIAAATVLLLELLLATFLSSRGI